MATLSAATAAPSVQLIDASGYPGSPGAKTPRIPGAPGGSGNRDGLLEHLALAIALTHGALQLAFPLGRFHRSRSFGKLELGLVDLRSGDRELPGVREVDVPA